MYINFSFKNFDVKKVEFGQNMYINQHHKTTEVKQQINKRHMGHIAYLNKSLFYLFLNLNI